MQQFAEAESVQVQGCSALQRLAVSDAQSLKACAAGGIEAAVGAMLTHARSPDAAEQACAALQYLIVDAATRARAVGSRAIPAVLSALK